MSLPAAEQEDWTRLGGPGEFADLVAAFEATPGIGLDTHRRVRLAITLATLARRGLRFARAGDAANLLLPLIALSPEARQAGEDAVQTHWRRANPRTAATSPAPAPVVVRVFRAVGAPFWLALGAVALLVGLGAIALYLGGAAPITPTPPPHPASPEAAGQFWPWAWRFYARDLSYRIDALIVIGSVTAIWLRHVRATQAQRLHRDRRSGGVADVLRVDPPQYFRSAATRQAGRTLRRPIRFPGHRLDVERTVRATVAAGGFLTPAQRLESLTPDILLLIDRSSLNDQLADIASSLAKRMRDGGTEVFVYEFTKYPDLLEAVGRRRFGGHPVLTLGATQTRHVGARIVIVSAGVGLFESYADARLRGEPEIYGFPRAIAETNQFTGSPRRRLFPGFAPSPVLLTPTPVDRWGPAETALERAGVLVSPLAMAEDPHFGFFAAAEAQVGGRAAAAVRTRARGAGAPGMDRLLLLLERPDLVGQIGPDDPALRARVAAAVVEYSCARLGEPAEGPEPESIFDPDPFALVALSGVAALALFPRIEPDLTCALWRLATGHDPSLARLSRLARLPWFRRASMPDWLRADIANFARQEMTRLGQPQMWDKLRQALGDWTRDALAGDSTARGVPVYSAQKPGAPGLDPDLRARLERAAPDVRALFEERLFFGFLTTGEILDDPLSVTLKRPTRMTPTQRLALAGLAGVGIAWAATAPWLAGKLQGAVRGYAEQALSWKWFLVFSPVGFSWAISIIALVTPRLWPQRAGWIRWPTGAVIVGLAAVLALFAGALQNADERFVALFMVPFAALALIFPPADAAFGVELPIGVMILLGFAIDPAAKAAISPEDFDGAFWRLSVITLITPALLFALTPTRLKGKLLTRDLYYGSINLLIWILSCAIYVILYNYNNISLSINPTSIYYIWIPATTFQLYLRSTPLDRSALPRALFLGAGLCALATPFPTPLLSVPTTLSAATLGLVALFLLTPRLPARLRDRAQAWLRPAQRLAARGREIDARTPRWLAILLALALGFIVAAGYKLTFFPAVAASLQPFDHVAWANPITAGVCGGFLALMAQKLYDARPAEAAAEKPRPLPGELIAAALWGLALAPPLLASLSATPSRLDTHSTLAFGANLWATAAWAALPLAFYFLRREGGRALGPVLLGLVPFLSPWLPFGFAAPGGMWALAIVALWARWRESPSRLGRLLPTPRSDNTGLAGLPQSLPLAGFVALMLALLAPEAWIAAGGGARLIDPQPMRAMMLFLIGATAWPRASIRLLLLAVAIVSLTLTPFEARLADASLTLLIGPTPLAALELALAYELAPLARWVAGKAGIVGFSASFVLAAGLGSLAYWEAGVGLTPVLFALIGVAGGLMQPVRLPPNKGLGSTRDSFIERRVRINLKWATFALRAMLYVALPALSNPIFADALSAYFVAYEPPGVDIGNPSRYFFLEMTPVALLVFGFVCVGHLLAPALGIVARAAPDVDPSDWDRNRQTTPRPEFAA